MRRLLICLLTLLSLASQAQIDQRLPAYGYEMDRLRVIKALEVPYDSTLRANRNDSLRFSLKVRVHANPDSAGLFLYNPYLMTWGKVGGSSSSGTFWSTQGNAGTDQATDFWGTTDTMALRIRINNQRFAYLPRLSDAVSLDSNYVSQIYFGHEAGGMDTLARDGNIAIGNYAMRKYPASSSQRNGSTIAIGHMALHEYQGGGSEANVAIGWRSMARNISGHRNVGVGLNTLHNLTTGLRNTGLGSFAMEWATTGSDNTSVGESSMRNHTIGQFNAALGNSAGYSNSGSVLGITNLVSSSDWTTATVTISAPDETPFGFTPSIQATGTAIIDGGQIVGVTITEMGRGYSPAGKTITFTGDGTSATADLVIGGGSNNTYLGAVAGYTNRVGFGNIYAGVESGYGDGSTSQARIRDTSTILIGNDATVNRANAATDPVTNAVAIGVRAKVGASNSGVLGGTGSDLMAWGIGTETPSQKSLLDLSSTTRYALMPRMNTTQQNAISSPEAGALIYNTDSAAYVEYNGAQWRIMTTGTIPHFNRGIEINKYANSWPSVNTLLDNGPIKLAPGAFDAGVSQYRAGTDFGGNTHVTYRTNNADLATKTGLGATQTLMQWVGYAPGSDGSTVSSGYHMRFRSATASKATTTPTFFEMLLRDTIGTGSIFPKIRIWPYGTIIGDNVTSVAPDPGAVLTLSSTDKGFRPPVMTAAQRLAIVTPGAGVVVYDSDSARYMLYNGSWKGLAYTGESGGGAAEDLQTTLDAGSTLSSAETIDAQGNDFSINGDFGGYSNTFGSSSSALRSFSSGNTAIVAIGEGHPGLTAATDLDTLGAITTLTDHASNNSILPGLSLQRSVNGGSGANGNGIRIDFRGEDAAGGTARVLGSLGGYYSNATNRTSRLIFQGLDADATETFMEIEAGGIVKVNNLADTLATLDDVRAGGSGGGENLQATLDLGSTLTSDETIVMGTNTLTISGSAANPDNVLAIAGSGTGSTLGVSGNTTNASQSVTNAGSVAGILSGSTSGASFMATSTGGANFSGRISNASTNTTLNALNLVRGSDNTPANNMGVSWTTTLETTTSDDRLANRFSSAWLDATDGTRESIYIIEGVSAGTTQNVMEVRGSGATRLNKYGDGTITGTATYLAGFDTDGNIVEVALGGGSGEANTASNLGGGLANWHDKSGVDLRFNTFNATDFDLASNLISIDYTNGQAASGSTKGFLTSADWTTFNGKLSTITVGTTTLTSGADTRVLFDDGGVVGEDAGMVYDKAADQLQVGTLYVPFGGRVRSERIDMVSNELGIYNAANAKLATWDHTSGRLTQLYPATFESYVTLKDIGALSTPGAGFFSLSINSDKLIGKDDGGGDWIYVGEANAQTLTNKTLALGSNTLSGSVSDFNTALTGDDFATLDNTVTLTNKRITPRTGTVASSATPTINTDNVDFFSITAQTVDITSMTTNLSGTPTDGQKLWIAITGTASRAIAWGASFEASTVALPTTTSGTSRLDCGFVWNAATSKWRIMASQ
jgi:hypothetical protein